MARAAKLPFVIGITGHMRLEDGEIPAIRESVRTLFRFLKTGAKRRLRESDSKEIDPHRDGPVLLEALIDQLPQPNPGGTHPDGPNSASPYRTALGNWPGLEGTPIVVLSSLALGADQLVAEIAMEEEFQQLGFTVRAPLPFEHSQYREASTFVHRDKGNPDSNNGARQEEYDRVLGLIGPDNTFPITTHRDIDFSHEEFLSQLQSDRDSADDSHRNGRYLAAGEYVAANSHLLIAIWDHQYASDSTCGTAAIVKARRSGLTPDLLPTSRSLTLADAGPVWHLYARHEENATERSTNETWSARLLHACDSSPEFTMTDDDAQWQKTAGDLFCSVGRNIVAFNKLDPPSNDEVNGTHSKWLTYKDASDQDCSIADSIRDKSPQLNESLRDVTQVYCMADSASIQLQVREKSTLKHLFWITIAAAFLLHLFAHWHPQTAPHTEHHSKTDETESHDQSNAGSSQIELVSHAQNENEGNHDWSAIQFIFGLSAMLAATTALVGFWWCSPARTAERGHDYRAIAEGLRIQFFWNLAGLGNTVSSNYMHRQRGELNWIRGALRPTATPLAAIRREFKTLAPSLQILAFRATLENWISNQTSYYEGQYHKRHNALHFWHTLGRVLALAGVGVFATLCATYFLHGDAEWAKSYFCVLILLSMVISHLGRLFVWAFSISPDDASNHHDLGFLPLLIKRLVPVTDPHVEPSPHVYGRRLTMAYNFLMYLPLSVAIALFVLGVSGGMSRFPDFAPAPFALAIIGGGFCLVSGALAVAWAEKNLFSEFAYQFHSMFYLFRSAERQLIDAIGELETQIDKSDEFNKTRVRIQGLLGELGREALAENADWLVLHRARPLEPVMAG